MLNQQGKSEEDVKEALCGETKIAEDENKSNICSCGGNC